MVGRATAASILCRTPLVAKVAGDPAYERSRRRGLYHGSLEAFQRADLPPLPNLLRSLRSAAARRAAHIVCSSEFFRDVVRAWGVPPERTSILLNALPQARSLPPTHALRAHLGIRGPTIVFAGRLTPAKSLEMLLAAAAQLEDVSILIVGTGEERGRLEALSVPRVRFVGAVPRQEVVDYLAAADGAVLVSSWETGRPHVLVEALSVGTPVIATRVGGVPEVVADEVNGLLVEPGDVAAFVAAVRRFFADEGLRRRLAEAAPSSVADHAPERVFPQLERILREAAAGTAR
jgi:D-inositol-3-phosphate glycosyltransferase